MAATPDAKLPPLPPPAPASATSHARTGHRPLLTPAQALFLARELYGICNAANAVDGGGGGTGDVSTATELPSYDDRNFLISVSVRQEEVAKAEGLQPPPPQQQQQHGAAAELAAAAAAATAAAAAVDVVLKVHNSQDSGRVAQLKAMDEAMLRLQAAGVLTNTPLRPVGHHHRHHRHSPASSGRNSGSQTGDVAVGSSGSSSSGAGGKRGEVSYRVTTAAEEEEEEQDQDGSALAPGPPRSCCCWAHLPSSTCRLVPEEPAAADAAAAAAAAEAAVAVAPAGGNAQDEERSEAPGELAARSHWHVVRCLTYVPGHVLSSVSYLTPDLLLSWGGLMGRVSAGLAGWEPPALRRCSHDWYPENGAEVLRRLVPHIEAFDEGRKSLLLAVAEELAAAGPRLADPDQLPRQVCHGDANGENCLVSDDGREVVGLIDFGDMAIMPRVCEVAITMLYAMLLGLNRPMGQPAQPGAAAATQRQLEQPKQEVEEEETDGATLRRLLRVAGLVLCGFQRVVRLRAGELRVVPLLLRGRLAQSLALGAASVLSDPTNAEYLLATQRPGWRVIRLLTHGSVMTDEEMVQHMLRVESELEA
ncbi:hypothetical protein PLESTB_000718200 [Pleodorina starrii]|uniref:Hydroxylysine kinase n=1 Tax=Pleodorina starrii TaxID=330485 RepID=A0A9W6BJ90_9CHLO|nr:hypothetical protein PLESTM_001709300 [Pleodorina starrii]GLC53192.1 hypothetical protein PLESTB_000718200 [Pleodorina starrii]